MAKEVLKITRAEIQAYYLGMILIGLKVLVS
jgi:hypothetical protein